MPDLGDYTYDADLAYARLRAAVRSVPKNVRSGQILPQSPPGSYYTDGNRTAISARTIATFADYSVLPKDHPIYEPENRGKGEGRSPLETERIQTYTAARGSVFHLSQEMSADSDRDLEEFARQQLCRPPEGDSWRDIHETLGESAIAPEVEPPREGEDSYETLVQRLCWEVVDASRIYHHMWKDIKRLPIGNEIDFIAEENGNYRWGGRVDQINIIEQDNSLVGKGVFSTELKLTDEIRSRDIVLC